MEMLTDKVIAVFASYGEIASEVAVATAAEGAKVYLSGRDISKVEVLAKQIRDKGGLAEAFQVDAMKEDEIDAFLKQIVEKENRLDGVFNGIGIRAADGAYGTPSTRLSYEDFMKPIELHLGSQFLTARRAGYYMMETQSPGTILTLTASLSRIKVPFMTGITAACTAIEGMTRGLAAEFGMSGIRAICLNPTALGETRTIRETNAENSKTMGIPADEFAESLRNGYLMGKSPTTQDIGNLAAFLFSETGALLNSHIVDADFGARAVI